MASANHGLRPSAEASTDAKFIHQAASEKGADGQEADHHGIDGECDTVRTDWTQGGTSVFPQSPNGQGKTEDQAGDPDSLKP